MTRPQHFRKHSTLLVSKDSITTNIWWMMQMLVIYQFHNSFYFFKLEEHALLGWTHIVLLRPTPFTLHRHSVSKTSHLWFAITLTRVNGLIFFGRNVAHEVSNQKTLHYVTSNNLHFCTTGYLVKRGNAKIAFSPQTRCFFPLTSYQLFYFCLFIPSRSSFSPLSSSTTLSLFHSQLQAHLFHKPFPT